MSVGCYIDPPFSYGHSDRHIADPFKRNVSGFERMRDAARLVYPYITFHWPAMFYIMSTSLTGGSVSRLLALPDELLLRIVCLAGLPSYSGTPSQELTKGELGLPARSDLRLVNGVSFLLEDADLLEDASDGRRH